MKNRATVLQMEPHARKFITEYIRNKPLGLPAEMSEDDFKKTMDAIVRVMMAAWLDGYMKGCE